jgi:hypothetical protein
MGKSQPDKTMKNKSLILVLFVLLMISASLAVAGFLRKGEASPPVILVVQSKEYNYAGPGKLSSFWNNYPYWVMLSEGKRIDSATMLTDSAGNRFPIASLLGDKDRLFFRFSPSNDAENLDSTLSIINRTNAPVLLLTSGSDYHWQQGGSKKTAVYNLPVSLTLPIEKGNLSYFFSLGKDLTVRGIYVPRKETAGLTVKYLEYMENINKP